MEKRMCTTEQLIALHRIASDLALNRQGLTDEALEDVDPDGTHVLVLVLWGHNMDTAPILHHRVQVLTKMKDQDAPLLVFLDIPDVDWRNLRLAQEAT